MVFRNELDPEFFLTYFAIFSQLIPPFKAFSNALYAAQKGMASLERIQELVTAPVTVEDPISPVKPLGSYALTFQLKQALTLDVSTINGPLLLTAHGIIKKGRLSLLGDATASPESIDSLIGLLSIIGKKDGAVYRFKI
jgi:ABC-type multidrug transport system fused ATPase/permease subunit